MCSSALLSVEAIVLKLGVGEQRGVGCIANVINVFSTAFGGGGHDKNEGFDKSGSGEMFKKV